MIENTTLNPRIDWVLGGNPGAIEAQEARGQQQLAVSSQLPTDGIACAEGMGIKVIGPVEGDPLFMKVELPAGWQIKPTDHSMWSDLLDDKGRKRAGIFYKAAYYDRSAHMGARCRYNSGSEPQGGYDAPGYNYKTTPLVAYVNDGNTRLWTSAPIPKGEKSWEASDTARAMAHVWALEHFPLYEDTNAYWD